MPRRTELIPLRSIRADFQPELWAGLGVEIDAELYAISETFVALGVMVLFGLVMFIRGNRRAFFVALGMAMAGVFLIAVALIGNATDRINAFTFMVLIGLGIYLPYVAVHTTIFERLIAMTRDRGNIGYLLYLADAFGYLGYVAVVIGKNIWGGPDGFLEFFLAASGIIVGVSVLMLASCWIYFARLPTPQGA